jgi:hypothetical protein
MSFLRPQRNVSMHEEDFIAWKRGKYIQDVLSYLSSDTRELMISGICGDCYDNTFGVQE